MLSWCVAHTQPLKESFAKQNLIEQGYEVYLPFFKKDVRHARKIEQKTVPLFPRYIFVGLDLEEKSWRSINGTRGISNLLMSSEIKPAILNQNTIDELKSQEIEKDIVHVCSMMTFIKGDKIRITEGAFKDHVAFFEKMDDKSRVQLLLNFMGREIKMNLPIYALEAA